MITETEAIAYTLDVATKLSGLSRTSLYEAVGRGDLQARKAGSRTLIPADSLRSFINNLPEAEIKTGRKSAA